MKFLFYALLLFVHITGAQTPTGGIPNKYMNDPAYDLVQNGKQLFPDEVHALIEKSRGRFDISTLNPIETSDIWKNVYPGKLPEDKNPVIDLDEVNFHSPTSSATSGFFRFNVQDKSRDNRIYTMVLGKQIHKILLAKALLRKIGYIVPNIKWIPRIVIRFKDEKEKAGFGHYLNHEANAGDPKSWIVEDLDETSLMVQDLIIMESSHPIYNLALGVTDDMPQGRRLFSALAVPLSIVNNEESVNMFRWNVGYVQENKIQLFNPELENFQCTWDDARWIARRIEKLKREDWEEIAEASQTPKSVQMLLTEKMISRRNNAMKLFKVDFRKIAVDSDISNGIELVKGKLTQQKWPGYGSRFAYGDPDSPLSSSEIWSWVKSFTMSNLIDITVAQFNQLPGVGNNAEGLLDAEFEKTLEEAWNKSQETKTPFEVPLVPFKAVPTLKGQLILNRNLMTGTYLGTDNLVQLVDTVGISVAGGYMGSSLGLPKPLQFSGMAEVQYVRTYSHLRPVTSIQKSLKYPFKNILVPLVQRDYGKKLYEAAMMKFDNNTGAETRAARIAQVLKPFKENMLVGESIIITDNLAPSVGGQLTAGYEKLLSAGLGLSAGYTVVSRFHIHRKTEDDFHIYKDIGNVASVAPGFNLDSLIPVVKLSYKKSWGGARVKFYNLNLNPNNPNLVANAGYLRRAITWNTTGDLDADESKKPFIIKHKYNESNPGINLAFWQWQWQSSNTDVSIQNPAGDVRDFKRNYLGSLSGRNYQAYVNNTISLWIDLLFDRKAGISERTGANPGYSFKGVAKTKFLNMDQEIGKNGESIDPFIKLSRIHNGWESSRSKAEKIVEELRNRYRHNFYDSPVLSDTRRIFLYRISLNFLFYQKGIEFLLSLPESSIREIYRLHLSQKDLMVIPNKIEDEQTGVDTILRYLAKSKSYQQSGKQDKANKYLLKAVSHFEDKLTMAGIVAMVGGEENLYMNSRIDGFREGDEDGDKPIFDDSLGEFGSPKTQGPLVYEQNKTQMLEGEFFIYWLMQRLI